MRSKDAQRMWRLAARYSSVGVEMALAVAIGASIFHSTLFVSPTLSASQGERTYFISSPITEVV